MGLKCRFCESTNIQRISILHRCLIYQCKDCLLIQTKVEKETLQEINISKYNDKYLNEYEQERSEQLTKFYAKCIKDIENLKKGGNILDVGCGPGLFLKVMLKFSKYEWEIKGIDINKKSLLRVDKEFKNKVFNSSIECNKFHNGTFDVITCFDSFEHFSNVHKSLNEIYRILNKQGFLVIQVPNYDSTMKKFCGNDWDWWCIPDHVCHFQYPTLKSILLKNGFKTIKVKTWEPFEVFVKNIQGHIKKTFSTHLRYNKIIAKLFFLPLLVIWIIHGIIDVKKGGLIYLIAQKQ